MTTRIKHHGSTLALAIALFTGCAADAPVDEDVEGAPVDVAVKEAALSKIQTLTTLNLGQNLGSNTSGTLVVSKPNASDSGQGWELLFPGSAGSSEPGFGSAFQLKNQATQKCAEDVGLDASVAERTCAKNPGPNSPQLWQHHIAADRVVNGSEYRFVFNRGTDRVLSRSPTFGNAVPALSAKKATNDTSAAAALQQWTLRRR
ncbi:MAG: hypothetical protein ABW252_17995 [Polyangiales bacterium]